MVFSIIGAGSEDGEKEEPKEQYHKNNGNLVNIC